MAPPREDPEAQAQNVTPSPSAHSEKIVVSGIPSFSAGSGQVALGQSGTVSTRSYTPLKVLGDGAYVKVVLCDWHSDLPSGTPVPDIQHPQDRPQWAGMRLAAVKRMKKKWEGGWDECSQLKELEILRVLPHHPNIIRLYDAFVDEATLELSMVFEPMEGNLYHLIKARKGRPFADGLLFSMFRQMLLGIDHVHSHGYFHRDLKPENIFVTTTGFFDYPVVSPTAPKQKDVVAVLKIGDFGLARKTESRPPYTEYVTARWYRAPEILLLSRHYSSPADMWSLGTIMAELINLRPLFPGCDQIDQVTRINMALGNPTDEYERAAQPGAIVGGGAWEEGIRLANNFGMVLPRFVPKDMSTLFPGSTSPDLVACIRDLLRWNPEKRLTSHECLNHAYFRET